MWRRRLFPVRYLGAYLSDPGVRPGVVLAAASLSERHTKLFRTHHEGHGATDEAKRVDNSRTFDGSLRQWCSRRSWLSARASYGEVAGLGGDGPR
jgi:hypothetical protein